MKASDICNNALFEIGALAAGETATAEDAAFVLSKLNRLFDNWNADGDYIYGTTISDFTLIANHNPHSVGLSGNSPDLIVSVARPAKIDQAELILTDVTPNIYRPLDIKDDDWWLNNPLPTLSTQIPYYLYYNADWPNGQIYLWPVPTVAYGLRLKLWTLLSNLTADSTFTLPPGYEDAVTLTLAESLAPAFEKQISPLLLKSAQEARARIKVINSDPPTMSVDGSVQSVNNQPRANYANFLAGFIR